jgi:hypothetical protein
LSLHFHSRNDNLGAFQNTIFLPSPSSDYPSLKMCNLKLRKSRSSCIWTGTNLTCFLVSNLFLIYLTTLFVPQTTHGHVIGLLVNMNWKK